MDDFREHSKKKVLLFLRKQVYEAPPEHGPCIKAVLRHLRADGSPTSDIETYIVPRYLDASNAPSMDDLERGADDLVNSAIEDANGLGRGVQRYVVLSFHDKRPGEHSSRCILRVSGGRDSYSSDATAEYGVGDVSDTETPDAKGLTAQHMRHTEAMMKHSIAGFGHIVNTLTQQNGVLSSHLTKFMERHIQTITVVEELVSQRHQRELETKRQEVVIRGVEDVADKLKILLPHLVNKAVGRKLLPTRSSPSEQELTSLIETLRPEQVDKLKTALTPDQLLALLSIIERVTSEGNDEKKPEKGELIVLPTGGGK